MNDYKIVDTKTAKFIRSEDFNMNFLKSTGFTQLWGKTFNDDSSWCEAGPLLADIEITDICSGIKGKDGIRVPCKFCYKDNSMNNKGVMTLETFKKVFAKLPKTVTQIAFGADATGTTNPDMLDIMRWSREHDVVPNVTLAEIDDSLAGSLVKVCGAVAVSYYPTRDKAACYDSVARLAAHGLTQVNIHCMTCDESYETTIELLDDVKTDERLKKLNAVVFLSLKPKGRGTNFHALPKDKFKDIVDKAISKKIGFGFDSCSAPLFLEAVKDSPDFKRFKMMSEPCESTLQSSYINWRGEYFPCSFCEGEDGWKTGIDVLEVEDFVKDVWHNPRTTEFREKLIGSINDDGCRCCPMFKVGG